MENILGILLIIVSVVLLYAAFQHRRRILAQREELKARGVYTPSFLEQRSAMVRFTSGAAPIIILLLGMVGIKMVFMFNTINPQGGFSRIDLYGFLIFLAAYGAWMITRLNYRTPKASAERTAQTAVMPEPAAPPSES